MDKFFDWSSKVIGELPKISSAAMLVGVVVLFLAGPITLDALLRPDLALYQTALRTMPLTLTVCSVVIAVSKNWFENPFAYVVFAGFAIVLSAGIADYAGYADSGGTTLIRSAHDLAYDLTSKMGQGFAGGVFNFIPFLLACVVQYFRLYGPGTFIASFICGWFLAMALMRLAKVRVEGNPK